MSEIASSHIKPCNIAQSEAHNWRTKEYMQNTRKESFCIREELSRENLTWVSPELLGKSLDDYHKMLASLVKKKTGRRMQVKVRKRINKKTGKVVEINGSSAIRENIVRCKKNTDIEDLQRYCKICHDRWGILALKIHLHRDEGHWIYSEKQKVWIPHYHAHVIWDWIDHKTGKSYKLNHRDMSGFQDVAAEVLDMERSYRGHKSHKDPSPHENSSSVQQPTENKTYLEEQLSEYSAGFRRKVWKALLWFSGKKN